MAASHRRLDLEDVGEVTVARFIDKKILDESNIQVIGNQMFSLVEDDGRRKVLLIGPIVIIGVYPALLINIFQPAVRLIVGGS